MGIFMEIKIEFKRSILERLLMDENTKLTEGKILKVSTELDELITAYYVENLIEK